MRLTLRTLLAYLDNTLDPQDSEALRRKIEESGFATELVSRLRAAMSSSILSAPEPDAASPLQDANSIGEYLDSFLTPEQVAEVERACLESDTGLAEVAACHQILTIALGQTAEVPPALRQRLYEAPEVTRDESPGNFSSVAIPDEPALPPVDADVEPALAPTAKQHPAVQPVGPLDSGVSDAPTRIRKADSRSNTRDSTGGSLAGVRPSALTKPSDFYAGSIRPSRITPWLVSLGLVAVLLFALTQIFRPLLDRRGTDAESLASQTDDAASLDGVPAVEPEDPSSESLIEEAEGDAPPIPSDLVDETDDEASDATTQLEPRQPEAEPQQPEVDLPNLASDDKPSQPLAVADPNLGENAQPTEATSADPLPAPKPPSMTSDEAASAPAETASGTNAVPVEITTPDPIAKVISDDTLLAVRHGEQPWVRAQQESLVLSGSTVVCPPYFHASLATSANIDIKVVGPARLSLEGTEAGDLTLAVEYGDVMLAANEPNTALELLLAGKRFRCSFIESEAVVAIETRLSRDAGVDPRNRENVSAETEVIPVLGSVTLDVANQGEAGVGDAGPGDALQVANSVVLATGSALKFSAETEGVIEPTDRVPAFVGDPDATTSSIDRSARAGLLAFINQDATLEISLREAVNFRRVEIGALAARTLLLLGHSDVYFGGSGVLNQGSHKNYWVDHFATVRMAMNHDPESVDAAISRMDGADYDTIWKFLVGYTQAELIDGGDQQLVDALSSSSMAVRALALENLRLITGETLYFKPWESNTSRRENDAKKWRVRLRRGDIRWPVDTEE